MQKLINKVEFIASATNFNLRQGRCVESNDSIQFILLKSLIIEKIYKISNEINENKSLTEDSKQNGFKNEKKKIFRKIKNQIKETQNDAQKLRDCVENKEKELMLSGIYSPNLENRYIVCNLIDRHVNECHKWLEATFFGITKNNFEEQNLFLKTSTSPKKKTQNPHHIQQNSIETAFEYINDIDEQLLIIKQSQKNECEDQIDTIKFK